MTMSPDSTQYDYMLGIEPDIINYIKEGMVVQSRVSPMPCYLFFQNVAGVSTGTSTSPIPVSSFINTPPNYRMIIWSSGSNYPDVRPYTNSGQGNITVLIDGTPAVRIFDVADLQNNNEFAVVERKDLLPPRVDVVFNSGFNPSLHTIQYYYTTFEEGISDVRVKRGEGEDQSIFGWTQYLDPTSDVFHAPNQILVRLPISIESLVVNEEGKVKLQENQSWMIWTPYVHNRDLLVFPAVYTYTGRNEIYEIMSKQDSIIQGQLITQRFKLKLLEYTDPRYNLPIAVV